MTLLQLIVLIPLTRVTDPFMILILTLLQKITTIHLQNISALTSKTATSTENQLTIPPSAFKDPSNDAYIIQKKLDKTVTLI